jgi:hypothetical protein
LVGFWKVLFFSFGRIGCPNCGQPF